ncbi:MAG: hypothetical protein Q4B46_10190 [Comamonadaceae bacterium]|nr:hypothetical protein [Comamonadaceae bacterium]
MYDDAAGIAAALPNQAFQNSEAHSAYQYWISDTKVFEIFILNTCAALLFIKIPPPENGLE